MVNIPKTYLDNSFQISVIIPTYNRKHTLERAIESVLAQTVHPLEIIVIDDSSTDGTSDWIQSKYPSIILLQTFKGNLPKGVSAARNAGIKVAKGNWISLLDSDDEWLPDKLAKQVQSLKKNPTVLFCHSNEIWIRDGIRINQHKKHQKYGGNIFEKCLDICRISPSSSIMHKSIFDDVGYFDETLRVCEDYDLWLRITPKYSILFVDEPLIIKYGGHDDQLSRTPEGIEQYRIQSLEKIMDTESLTGTQFQTAKDMLIHKLNIYANGLIKRDKKDEYQLTLFKIKKLHDITD
ncbi:MAG: glycosyltransferase [Candidatus Marinimicrobia bacterium]|jgi:glycosyltransferase involved in cell wall biosynthesis|nr:glycosyltransferase [Candidatus Neomarinimicrobiota bacterium]MBT3502811.1 glycosyltransferase [Candidatus Neomarinimicrobiota bacterium]MBT3839153.1 glycosyltransferase [Candidatus Neomarinimicrobiota bacterium]MBT4000374.1 glycosyltransferase [Candidatus Neomarinimicrobiota bacterium]MBT4283641.1 glycosyltransferase [Candidatus Neomarinimicrobiota bacterium]